MTTTNVETLSDAELDEMLQNKIDNLSTEIAPQRDLWQGIEHAIESTVQQSSASLSTSAHNKPLFMPVAWAASVVAAVLLSWVILVPQDETLILPDSIIAMNQQFQQQKQTMLVSFGQPNLAQLPLEMQEQLSQLDSAKKSLHEALIEDPNNADLLNMLGWLHQQELSLLEQLYSPKWQSI